MKKKFLFIIISALICGLLGVLAEIFIFNFKPLTSNDNSTFEIPYSTQKSGDETKLDINLDNQYIRQILIEYSTPEDVEYSIDYTYLGTYNRDETGTFTDTFDNSFTLSATNLDATVSKLTISYDNEHSSKLEITKIIVDNAFHFNYFRTAFISLALFTICLLFLFYKDGFRTEKIHIYFACICSLLGLMIIVAQPAMNFFCWDDQTHFDRVINFPIGIETYNNGEFNMSDIGTINHTWHESTNSFTEHRVRASFLDSEIDSGYTNSTPFLAINKIPYLPMATGYHLAKLIGSPFTFCFLVGKIFNLLFYVLLMTYAIKTIVVGKRLLTVIALIPTNVFLASEYSYDPAVFAGVTIFIVSIINLLLDKTKKFDFKTAIIMIASMTYACLAKAVYAPIMLLTLLVPKEKFKNLKQSRLVKTGFVLITLLLGVVLFLPSLDGTDISDTRGGDVSAKDQISLIASHPLDYATIIKDNTVDQFSYKLLSPNTITNFSYTHSFTDRSNFYYIFFILLIFVFLTDNRGNRLVKKQRCWLLGTVLFIILLIWSALYISFTPVGLAAINGVQNRYFLPLLFPLLFCLQFSNIQNKINPRYYNLAIFTLASIAMILMIYQFILVPYNF